MQVTERQEERWRPREGRESRTWKEAKIKKTTKRQARKERIQEIREEQGILDREGTGKVVRGTG